MGKKSRWEEEDQDEHGKEVVDSSVEKKNKKKLKRKAETEADDTNESTRPAEKIKKKKKKGKKEGNADTELEESGRSPVDDPDEESNTKPEKKKKKESHKEVEDDEVLTEEIRAIDSAPPKGKKKSKKSKKIEDATDLNKDQSSVPKSPKEASVPPQKQANPGLAEKKKLLWSKAESAKPWNDWNKVDLGNANRTEKMLRLMGAKKNTSESAPQAGLGAIDRKTSETLKRDLESQFTSAVKMKGSRRGLG
ncbi:small acidic protein family-domain-containing protein [Cladochytrium replicatum]|nr:small acidic protein family-domain-containing protein [Cladochytrium replicatum]